MRLLNYFMKNKKIIILGATGQIGKELSLEFSKIKNIETISHSRTKVGSSFFKFYNLPNIIGDLNNNIIMREISNADLIFDLAAPNHGTLNEIKKFYNKRFNMIIPFMKQNSKFVFASTMNAFGADNKRKKLKNYIISSSVYASNKRYAENYARKLCKKNSLDIYIIRLAEVHGKYQRASTNIMSLIANKFLFEIPNTPAWITFIVLIKGAIVDILENRVKPGLYTLTCDNIYWNELLEYFGKKINIKPKLQIIDQNFKILNKFKNLFHHFINSQKDFIRGNINLTKNFQDLMGLNYRIDKALKAGEKIKLKKIKIYRDYSRFKGILPGKRIQSIKYDKNLLLK